MLASYGILYPAYLNCVFIEVFRVCYSDSIHLKVLMLWFLHKVPPNLSCGDFLIGFVTPFLKIDIPYFRSYTI